MKSRGFSQYSNPNSPFSGQDRIDNPLSSFYSTFLTEKGKRKASSSFRDPYSGKKEEKKAKSAAMESGSALHEMIQSEYAVRGNLQFAELPIVDMKNLRISRPDIITNQNEIIDVKTISVAELLTIRSPRPEHKLQVLYYLNSLSNGSNDMKAIILYVAREAPGMRKAFEIGKDGESKILEGEAIRYMMLHKGTPSEEKMKLALDEALKLQQSPAQFADHYQQYSEEARKLRMRQLTAQKKSPFHSLTI